MADEINTTQNTEKSLLDDVLDVGKSFIDSRTGKGAAMGALMGQLLGSYKGPGGVNRGVDMSALGQIAPRTTTVAPPRYIPYSQYSAMDQVPRMSPEMMRDFGVSSGNMQYSPLSAQSYSAMPAMQAEAPRSYTSAGSGSAVLSNPTLTPRTETQINPLTGALLGSAIGYLTTPTPSVSLARPSSGTSGGTSGGLGGLTQKIYDAGGKFLGEVGQDIYDRFFAPSVNNESSSYYTPPNNSSSSYYTPPVTTGTVPPYDYGINYDETSNLNNSDSSYYKEGGMATPLMAEGGEVPHYYTYGKPVDPKEILAGMAKGGEAQKGGLPTHVPTIEGRHDYRSGSRVSGDGDGTSDDIPAMLADGEYVFSADVVSALGNGSTKAGADRLDHMVEQIRARDRSTHPSKLPPDAKSPLQYLKQSRSK
jgi:hypothetical protein